MTHDPDEPNDPDDRGGPAAGASGTSGAPAEESGAASRGLDEDAAWRAIVENYGDRAEVDPGSPQPSEAREDREARPRGLFQPTWSDPLETGASWDDEGHFVPPAPPPMPVLDPRRRLAWAGLFGSPLVMLVVAVLGWTLPGWLMLALAGAFAGGFVYLVATMPNRRPGDGSGDDGAVV